MKKEYIEELKQLFPSDRRIEDYCKALELYYIGKYAESQNVMSTMHGYRDCDKILVSGEKGLLAQLKDSKRGDMITYGSYYKQPIKWLVIEKNGSEVLLITKYGIECKKYNDKNESTSWRSCSLHYWLNNIFLKSSFTEFEQRLIIDKQDSSKYYNGRVFLLNINEAKTYLSQEERICVPTAGAIDNGAKKYENGACSWWLRDMVRGNKAVVVYDNGNILFEGDSVNFGNVVRPAIWIDLEEV